MGVLSSPAAYTEVAGFGTAAALRRPVIDAVACEAPNRSSAASGGPRFAASRCAANSQAALRACITLKRQPESGEH